jgi:hypothetical protein
MSPELPQPWRSFLLEVDARLTHDVQLHCCGGFVVTTRYGFPRTTADLDVLSIVPTADQQNLAVLAGRGSELHKTHGIYLDIVTVATYPEDYASRLQEMSPHALRHVRLLALDPYDLVLTKLTRNSDRDRADVEYLATAVPLDIAVLRQRYESEMRSYVAHADREGLTLELWSEIIQEAQARPQQ